jgi:hypothetical protein
MAPFLETCSLFHCVTFLSFVFHLLTDGLVETAELSTSSGEPDANGMSQGKDSGDFDDRRQFRFRRNTARQSPPPPRRPRLIFRRYIARMAAPCEA